MDFEKQQLTEKQREALDDAKESAERLEQVDPDKVPEEVEKYILPDIEKDLVERESTIVRSLKKQKDAVQIALQSDPNFKRYISQIEGAIRQFS